MAIHIHISQWSFMIFPCLSEDFSHIFSMNMIRSWGYTLFHTQQSYTFFYSTSYNSTPQKIEESIFPVNFYEFRSWYLFGASHIFISSLRLRPPRMDNKPSRSWWRSMLAGQVKSPDPCSLWMAMDGLDLLESWNHVAFFCECSCGTSPCFIGKSW